MLSRGIVGRSPIQIHAFLDYSCERCLGILLMVIYNGQIDLSPEKLVSCALLESQIIGMIMVPSG